ncbi:MAG: type II toxin-antitoxin system Phd/YefM family antitoxin [Prolixibacteraceae bacterium]|nr:type II toxin-antitoxin system Phd/YefM family antitoxin [Prolixibacteraceae bacterium]
MIIISSREFRDNQKKYFDLVDQNEQVIVQRGKRKSYILSPLNEIDRMSTNPELIAKIKKAEEQIAAGNVVALNSSEDIKTFLGL